MAAPAGSPDDLMTAFMNAFEGSVHGTQERNAALIAIVGYLSVLQFDELSDQTLAQACRCLIKEADRTPLGPRLDHLIRTIHPVCSSLGASHTMISTFLHRQFDRQGGPGPSRQLIAAAITDQIGIVSTMLPNGPNTLYDNLIQDLLLELTVAPYPAAQRSHIIRELCQEAGSLHPGPGLNGIVNFILGNINAAAGVRLHQMDEGLVSYANVFSGQNLQVTLVIQALRNRVNIEPPGPHRDVIIRGLLAIADTNGTQRNNIVGTLTALITINQPAGPLVNLVRGVEMNNLGHTGEEMLDFYLRARDSQGLQNAPAVRPPGPVAGGTWRFVRSVGRGGEGIAYFWAYVDNGNYIQDRVVQRNVVMAQDHWDNPFIWRNQNVGTVPAEIWMMSLFPPGTPNLLGSRGGNIDANNLSYTNYVEYVEHDTLYALITAHCTRRRIHNRVYLFKAFDESFLWHLFRSLVTGLRDMNQASRALAPTPLDIVHGDLHPGNVFLSREDLNVFRLYPTPKIADFGAAYATHASDPDNRDALDQQFHTAAFDPPELARVPFFGGFQHFGAADAVKALSPSNIYQVGAVMLCAMRLQTSPWPLINPRAPSVDDVDPARPLVGTHITAGYSQGLKDLVHSCLRWNRNLIPVPTWLLARIAVVGAPYFGANTLEDYAAHPARKPTVHAHKLWLSMTDRYAHGLRLP